MTDVAQETQMRDFWRAERIGDPDALELVSEGDEPILAGAQARVPAGSSGGGRFAGGLNSKGSINAKGAKEAGLAPVKTRSSSQARELQSEAAVRSAPLVAARLSDIDKESVASWGRGKLDHGYEGQTDTERAIVGASSMWSYGRGSSNANGIERERLNDAVRDEFALGGVGKHSPDEFHGARRAFARARYDQTQSELSGVESVGLFRGVRVQSRDDNILASVSRTGSPSMNVEVAHNPLSAWSSSVASADTYAKLNVSGDNAGVRLFTSVPREAVFATGVGGFGQPSEGEVVVLGTSGTVNVIPVKP